MGWSLSVMFRRAALLNPSRALLKTKWNRRSFFFQTSRRDFYLSFKGLECLLFLRGLDYRKLRIGMSRGDQFRLRAHGPMNPNRFQLVSYFLFIYCYIYKERERNSCKMALLLLSRHLFFIYSFNGPCDIDTLWQGSRKVTMADECKSRTYWQVSRNYF